MYSFAPESDLHDEGISPDLECKESPEKIISILLKPSSDRSNEELKRLYLFFQHFESFQTFWQTIPNEVHSHFLQDVRFIEVKQNKSVFCEGPTQSFYFLIQGSIFVLASQNQEIQLNSERSSFKNPVQRRGNVLARSFDPSFSTKNPNKIKLQDVLDLHHQFIKELKEGECFGEATSQNYNQETMKLVTRETCYLAVLSQMAYKRIFKSYSKHVKNENLKLIQQLGLGQNFSSDDLQEALQHKKMFSLNRNHVIYDIGDACEYIYIIQQGEVEITKEMQLDVEDEEIFDKGSIIKHNQDIDRARLVDLNPMWKRKFTMAKKQQIRVALLGSGQSFGGEEIISQTPLRYSKAIVKSLKAEILVIPIEKILESRGAEATINQSSFKMPTQPASIPDLTEKPNENEPIKPNQEPSQRLIKCGHKKSASFGALTQKLQQSIAVTTIKISKNRQALLNNFALPAELEDNYNQSNNLSSKNAVPINKSPKKEIVIVKSPTKEGGMKRLWESNLETYFGRRKKCENKENVSQVDPQTSVSKKSPIKKFILDKISIQRDSIMPMVAIKSHEKPSSMNNVTVTTKSFRATSPNETSLEFTGNTIKKDNFVIKGGMSRVVIRKKSENSCESKPATGLCAKKLGQIVATPNKTPRENLSTTNCSNLKEYQSFIKTQSYTNTTPKQSEDWNGYKIVRKSLANIDFS